MIKIEEELWVSKQRVHIVLEASKSAGSPLVRFFLGPKNSTIRGPPVLLRNLNPIWFLAAFWALSLPVSNCWVIRAQTQQTFTWAQTLENICHFLVCFYSVTKILEGSKHCAVIHTSIEVGHRHLKFSRRQQKTLYLMGDNQDFRPFSISNHLVHTLVKIDIFCTHFLSDFGQDRTKATWGLLNTIS